MISKIVCYYFDDIIKDIYIYFSDILLDKKLYENISVYEISYKILMGLKPLCIRFDKIDWFIRVRAGEFRYIVIFDHRLFGKICDKIKDLISEKSGITNNINHNSEKIRTDSYNSLPIEKILIFHNVIVLIKSVIDKNKNEYYFNIILEKGSHKDKPNTWYF